MKKIYSMLLMLVTGMVAMCLASCISENAEEVKLANDEVKVCFTYTLDTSNGTSMTRATGNSAVFNEFYEKIKTGELVAPTYDLTLTEVNTGATYSFKGSWANHEPVNLRIGTYHVVGSSKAEGDNIQEKCSFTFDETIDVSITSSSILLHAGYDSSLLIFSNSDIQSLQNYNGETFAPFFTFSTYRYAFVNDRLYLTEKRSEAYILGQYTSTAEFKVFTGSLNFEKGKYYLYNFSTYSFDVPPMDDGIEPADKSGTIDGHDYVDLGLPSGTLWATCNIGADSPEDYGLYFAWGETVPYGGTDESNAMNYSYASTYTKTYYDWSTYKFCNGSSSTMTKYCSNSSYGNNGFTDTLTELVPEDDAATANWGSEWCMPTIEQFMELINEDYTTTE